MMTIKAVRATLLCSLLISACTDGKPVVIQPGTFTQEWPTELRKELVTDGRCIIDQINDIHAPQGKLVFESGKPLDISGWAFSEKQGTTPALYIQLIGPALTYTALAQNRTPRFDVVQFFKLDPSWQSGFQLHATQDIEPNEYALEVLQPGTHGVSRCATPIILRIDPAKNDR